MIRLLPFLVLLAVVVVSPAELPKIDPNSPAQEKATFQLEEGFRIDLIASEPDIIDPVAMAFDERGRLFVCEMRGYPNGGVGTGDENRGRIRCLRDLDGDGIFETSKIFAEGLRFPMGITPWKGGVIVAVAPDIVYYPDRDGDDKAEAPEVLYTGFNLANIQQMVNSLTWAADGWIHGLAGNAAGTISSPQAPQMKPLALGARGFRFRPDVPGSLEPMSGGGQYGLCEDHAGHWFTATNSQHLRQIILQDRYLRQNSSAPITSVTLDIPEHGAACKVFRISPFEPWRLERTTRRVNSELAKRLPKTELVPGGFVTSACSPTVCTANLFPPSYRNSVFICDPANNVILRDTLHEAAARFTARRGREDREFLASTDNWFRPVQVSVGPDGALYVLDFYREVIETPLSLPEDIKAKLNLESRARGRIWRIAPNDAPPKSWPRLSELNSNQLVAKLLDPNLWTRSQAQRLLLERGTKDVVPAVKALLREQGGLPGIEQALAFLHRMEALSEAEVLLAIQDPLPGNREVGLRYFELITTPSASLSRAVAAIASDPSAMVRFQLALSAHHLPKPEQPQVLARLIAQDSADRWTMAGVTLSSGDSLPDLVSQVMALTDLPAEQRGGVAAFLRDAGQQLGRQSEDVLLIPLVRTALGAEPSSPSFEFLSSLANAMKNQPGGFVAWIQKRTNLGPKWEERVAVLLGRFQSAQATTADRIAMANLFAVLPDAQVSEALWAGLVPQEPIEFQLAVIQALGQQRQAEVTERLLKKWAVLGPTAQRELVEQLLQSPSRIQQLFDAIERKQFSANAMDSTRVALLRKHPQKAIRDRAERLLATSSVAKADILKTYEKLDVKAASVDQGRQIFKQHCATCHKIGTTGNDVGPRLEAVISGKTVPDLLTSIFDPNREIDPRYMNYVATLSDGRSITGIVASESSAAVTITRAENLSESIRRADLESLRSTGVSLMPEGFEKSLPPEAASHLLAFLIDAVSKAKSGK